MSATGLAVVAERCVLLRCVLDLEGGERWEWCDPPEAPSYTLEPYGLVVRRDSSTGKRHADVDVFPWHAVCSFSVRRERATRRRAVRS